MKLFTKKIKNFVNFKFLHNVVGMILLGMYHFCHIWVQTKRFMMKNLKMGMPGHVSVQTRRKIENTKILVHFFF